MTAPIVEDTENGHSCSQKQDISLRNGRTILSCDQARAIFMSKPTLSSNRKYHTTKLAKFYGVSPKTIRDIWVGRTWYRATYFLDASKPASAERLQKKLGRPRGAKDIKPRTKKHSLYFQSDELFSHDQPLMHIGQETRSVQETGSRDDYVLECDDCIIESGSPASLLSSNSSEMENYISSTETFHGTESCEPFEAPVDWAAYLSDGWGRPSPFKDPFHDDWAYWPKDFISAS